MQSRTSSGMLYASKVLGNFIIEINFQTLLRLGLMIAKRVIQGRAPAAKVSQILRVD